VKKATLGSRNAHKARELERLLPGWTIVPLEADDWPPETGATYLENARGKARFALEHVGGTVLGEDSGIEVAALGGRPGIESARYAPEGAPAIAKLLDELDGVADRAARYVCELVCITPDGEEVRGRGTLTGTIADRPRGTEGFGYDPVFVPEGQERTVAELGDAWKQRNSHRARAVRALLAALGAILVLAGCGDRDVAGRRVLDAFFARTPYQRALALRFPHEPGSVSCVLRRNHKALDATCSTEVTLVKPARAVVTLTEAWDHGTQAHTWFFFVRRNGTIQSEIEEGQPAPR
jgi:XTP/dITP diphosphohydrolase